MDFFFQDVTKNFISDPTIYMPPVGSDQKVPRGLSNLHSTMFSRKQALTSVTLQEKCPYLEFFWSIAVPSFPHREEISSTTYTENIALNELEVRFDERLYIPSTTHLQI